VFQHFINVPGLVQPATVLRGIGSLNSLFLRSKARRWTGSRCCSTMLAI